MPLATLNNPLSFAKKTNWGQMARLMSSHRSGVPLAYLLNFGNGRDGLLKGEEGDTGADVTFLLTQIASEIKALEQPFEFETVTVVCVFSSNSKTEILMKI